MFSSPARTEVLRALHYQNRPVGLRMLAWVAGIHPHSAERVVEALEEEGLVVCGRSGYRMRIAKCADHPAWVAMSEMFEAADRSWCGAGLEARNERAKQVLRFLEEGMELTGRARRAGGVA
ncbi:MAG TPA: hypothetical protein PKE55_10080 [Kiritimatiellia bacterium]|nr:hypothetical protein [Kiritimatiellia bacterium]